MARMSGRGRGGAKQKPQVMVQQRGKQRNQFSGDKRPRRGGRSDSRSTAKKAVYLEGRRALEEALTLDVPIKRVFIQDSLLGANSSMIHLIRKLDDKAIELIPRKKGDLDGLSSHGAHQGVVAELAPYQYAELKTILDAADSDNELVVVLDHVTDEGNFGAIVRSAEVVGAKGVVVANARAAQVGTAAYKTSAGAVLHLPIAQVSNIARAVEDLKSAGFWVIAATEHAERDIWHAPLKGKIAIIMGSEGSGISPLVLKTADDAAKLPQVGNIESLNVAQAATAFCYEWLRQNADVVLDA